jgi:hypothetical protein
MTKFVMFAFALTMIAGAADAKSCKDPTTGKWVKCPAAAATTTTTTTTSTAATTSTNKAPHCTKGKPCGNSCIKATDVCHKT